VCEYCGCQALAPIGELTREHDLVLSLVRDIRIAREKGDGPRAAELACRIAAVLGRIPRSRKVACSPRSRPISRTR
jgi:hypothetical protein